MDQETCTDLDQTDEDIGSDTVSDEELEAASGAERGPLAASFITGVDFNCC
jgi:hypothetical protein